MSETVPNIVTFGPDTTCNLDKCPVEWSVYQYRPSLHINIAFAIIFGIVGIVYVTLGYRWKTWAFMVGMLLGSAAEITGYIGRIFLYHNPFSFRAFMVQIICLTIAPVFYAGAIYVTISQGITHYGADLSRFSPRLLYCIFIPADVICLILQAAGGAMSTKSTGKEGVDISLAGLSLQVVALFLFLVIFGDYWIRYWYLGRALTSRLWIFVGGLLLSTLSIMARCAYRLAELKDGYSGEIITHELPFIMLEGVCIIIAASGLCFGHPGLLP